MSGVALGGLALLTLGWRLRQSRAGFALALQGGAVGILYLTVFAALHLYALMPAVAAFALLVSIAVLSAILAELGAGHLAPLVGQTFSLAHAPKAHLAIESRETIAKTLLVTEGQTSL